MSLSVKSRLKIVNYLKSDDAYKNASLEQIAFILDKMDKYEQLDVAEDTKGNLLYAWGWWMVTEKGLEAYKRFEPTKRINRGSNMIGVFVINGSLNVFGLLRLLRRTLRMMHAKTFTIYTTRKKFVTFNVKDNKRFNQSKNRAVIAKAMSIMEDHR